jgi:hypothetical protein
MKCTHSLFDDAIIFQEDFHFAKEIAVCNVVKERYSAINYG